MFRYEVTLVRPRPHEAGGIQSCCCYFPFTASYLSIVVHGRCFYNECGYNNNEVCASLIRAANMKFLTVLLVCAVVAPTAATELISSEKLQSHIITQKYLPLPHGDCPQPI
jgi:hypothetical protein